MHFQLMCSLQLQAVIVTVKIKAKLITNLSFPELQQHWSSQTQFQILMMDAVIDACRTLLSLQKYHKLKYCFSDNIPKCITNIRSLNFMRVCKTLNVHITSFQNCIYN